MHEMSYHEIKPMKSIAFNPLEYFEELRAAKVSDEQAQAHAKALQKVLEAELANQVAHLASKSDLALVRKDMEAGFAETKAEFALVRKDMEAGFAETKAEFALVRKDMVAGFAAAKADVELVRSELKSDIALVRKDVDAMQNTLVIRLSIIMASMFAFVELVHRVF